MLYTPNVEIIDSRDDSRYTYIVVDQCAAKVLKTRIKDECYVMRIVGNKCLVYTQEEIASKCGDK